VKIRKVLLKRRLIARDKDGKQAFCVKGSVAYLDENTFKLHKAMGLVEEVTNAKKSSKPKPAPEPEPDEADDIGADQPDI
jgi:hypothetical protein